MFFDYLAGNAVDYWIIEELNVAVGLVLAFGAFELNQRDRVLISWFHEDARRVKRDLRAHIWPVSSQVGHL